MNTQSQTIVIGAGAVGLSVALNVARRGDQVLIVDELPPANGASYGNAGFLVADTAMPIALPGMYKKVPSWLLDPEGPLRVRHSYLLKAMPFLFGWLRASNRQQVNASSEAMRKIHNGTFDEWRALVGESTYNALIRRTGQVYIWEGAGHFPTPVEDDLRANFGVEVKPLSRSDIADIYPGIAADVGRALLIPGNGHTVNPGRLCQAVLQEALQAGARVAHERVLRIWPDHDAGWNVMTSSGQVRKADKVIIAAGAASHELLADLGIHVPLESERGYHVVLPDASVQLAIPILHKTGYFGLNSMDVGMRLAGTVELAGLRASPDPLRCEVLIKKVRRLFPRIEHGAPKYWMGHRPSIPDSVPVIGPVPGLNGLYTCFGHGHCGLTAAPASASLLAKQMFGEPVDFDTAPYSIKRFMRGPVKPKTFQAG